MYIAMSLDGFIARPEGDIEWLASVARTGEDYGYRRFFDSVDTIVIGKKTYEDGAGVIQQFIAAGLVRRATLSIIPILLGEGIRLFGNAGRDVPLCLVRSLSFESGLVQLEYELEPALHAPLDAGALTFEPLTKDHLPLLLQWFNAPHAQRWYGRGGTLAIIEAEYFPSEGPRPTEAHLVRYAGRPIGLVEWCRFGDFLTERVFHEPRLAARQYHEAPVGSRFATRARASAKSRTICTRSASRLSKRRSSRSRAQRCRRTRTP